MLKRHRSSHHGYGVGFHDLDSTHRSDACGSSHSKNLADLATKRLVLLVLLKELGTSRYHLPADTKMTGKDWLISPSPQYETPLNGAKWCQNPPTKPWFLACLILGGWDWDYKPTSFTRRFPLRLGMTGSLPSPRAEVAQLMRPGGMRWFPVEIVHKGRQASNMRPPRKIDMGSAKDSRNHFFFAKNGGLQIKDFFRTRCPPQ